MIDLEMEDSGEMGVLTMDGELTIQRAAELKTALISSLASVEHLVLNLEKVAEVDLSCLQLLCSAHRTSVRSNKRLTWAGNRPESLARTVGDAGFVRHKGCVLDRDKSCLWVGGSS
jgi:anti-anti-sigma factor